MNRDLSFITGIKYRNIAKTENAHTLFYFLSKQSIELDDDCENRTKILHGLAWECGRTERGAGLPVSLAGVINLSL